MRETPGSRRPQRGAGAPWDAWTRSSPLERRPPGPRRPAAQHRLPAQQPRERSRWHWLLVAGVVIPLLTPLYNRAQPELLGVPFFYWCQIALTGMAAAVTVIVRLATRKRRGP